jgi:hypothetical protein
MLSNRPALSLSKVGIIGPLGKSKSRLRFGVHQAMVDGGSAADLARYQAMQFV